MTFGTFKTEIEKNLLETYTDKKKFKNVLKEFKNNVINDKDLSKVYSLYDQLSSPQGLSNSDAKEFLEEGVNLLQQLITKVNKLKLVESSNQNIYSDIDTLVYSQNLNLLDRVDAKKNIVQILTTEKKSVKESINIPIKSMISIANRTLDSYIETLDENSKKEFFQLVTENKKDLESQFETLKESTVSKLQAILGKENDSETKTKISETIDRINGEKFDRMNFVKLKNLEESI